MSKEQLDIILSKWISRKLLVFLIATLGLGFRVITEDNWVVIAVGYISIEGVTNIVERLKK